MDNECNLKGNGCCSKELGKIICTKNTAIERIFTAMADILIKFDCHGNYLDVVVKDQGKLVLPGNKLLNKNIADVLPENVVEKIKKGIKSALEESNCTGVETIEYELSVLAGVLCFEATIIRINEKELFAVIRDITERKKQERRIHYLSYHDKLTGLYNRAHFDEVVETIDKEENLPISVIMADVNGLKLVNDTYGHFTGDKMLQVCSDVLRENCRKEDILSRWGGDEFMILLPKTTKEEAEAVVERISFTTAYVKNVPVSISLGLSTKRRKDELLVDILRKAEDRMYDQKLYKGRGARDSVIENLLTALEEGSGESREHIYRMQKLAGKIGERVKLSKTEIERLRDAVLLHDIGKINISQELLIKKEPLSEEEKKIIQKHPELSYRIARSTDNFSYIAEDVYSHHERWDGRGYPRGLKKEGITLLGRIIAIVDAYDVMKEGRPYKAPKKDAEIVAELRSLAGKQFDPHLTETFLLTLKDSKIFMKRY